MEALIHALSFWSYFFLFGIVFFESAGLPLPGFSVALLAAALAGQNQELNFWLIFLVALSASTLGGMLGYWVGLRGGRVFLERYGRYALITPERLLGAERGFQKYGDKAVLFGRYLPFLCFMAGILSGITRLPYRRFLVSNFAGALLWSSSNLTLGFFFGRSLELLNKLFSGFSAAAVVIIVAVMLVMTIRRRMRPQPTLSRPIVLTLEEPREK